MVDAAGSSLMKLETGATARILGINGDRSMVRRFLALGLRVGTDVTLSHTRGSSVVVVCGGTRVALGPEMVGRLQLEPVG